MENSARLYSFPTIAGLSIAAFLFVYGLGPFQEMKKGEEKELRFIAEKAAQAFLIYEATNHSPQAKEQVEKALQETTTHARVIATLLKSFNQQVIAFARNDKNFSFRSHDQITIPIQSSAGKTIGFIEMEVLSSRNPQLLYMVIKTVSLALLGFLFAFAYTLKFALRQDGFLPQISQALKKIIDGQLEINLPKPRNQEEMEIITTFNQLLEGLHERDRMRHSLGRIMDPKIAEILIKEDPKLGGLRRQTTILFCDIRNYTSICEELSSEELQEFLNDYWKGTVEIIMEQEGTIDKFHGDGVCVVFGAPSLHADDPLRAVRTAWRLVKNVNEMNQKRELQRKMPIQIGIGIHTGEVIAGHIGSERRMDYTVVGDAVNVAARIEELNKKFGTQILISDTVYEKVENNVRVKTLTLAHLRGHKRPILVHTLREFFESGENTQKKAA